MANKQLDPAALTALVTKLKTNVDTLITKFQTDSQALLSALPVVTPPVVTPPVVTPPVVTPPTTGTTINVGDGKSGLVIDGSVTKYAPGTTIVVKPGTYGGDITLHNLTNVTVIGTGVIIDGSALSLGGLNSVVVKGFSVQNAIDYLRFDSRLVNTTIDNYSAQNCRGQLRVGYNVTWDGNDSTVQLLNLTLSNSIFDNVGILWFDGDNWGKAMPVNFVKGLQIYGCTFKNMDAGNVIDTRAVEGFSIHDNTFTNINKTNRDDTRLVMTVGNGDAYNNTFTDICGHSVAINPISWSTTTRAVSHFYNNITTNTARYSQYEVQQFSAQLAAGKNQACDVVIDKSTATNINTEHYGFNGAILDNYVGNPSDVKDLSKVTMTNCTGSNWYPVPTPGVYWNMESPAISSGNVYIN